MIRTVRRGSLYILSRAGSALGSPEASSRAPTRQRAVSSVDRAASLEQVAGIRDSRARSMPRGRGAELGITSKMKSVAGPRRLSPVAADSSLSTRCVHWLRRAGAGDKFLHGGVCVGVVVVMVALTDRGFDAKRGLKRNEQSRLAQCELRDSFRRPRDPTLGVGPALDMIYELRLAPAAVRWN